MAVYSLSPIFQPQYVAAAAAKLVFGTPGLPTVVPAQMNYQIMACRVANIDTIPVSLQVWRVPAGSAQDNQHIIVPTINIPVASQTFPYFDLTALWGVTLQPGDSIWAVAGVASMLVIHADGAVITV